MLNKKTPPHFYSVSPHPTGRRHCVPSLSRLRLGFTLFLFILFLISPLKVASASDLAKEKRWAEQISDALLDGEAIQLNNGTHDFLAIETHADEDNDLGIIVLHGIGIHPDWPAVIQPLRVELAEAGWNTLSLQLPILSNDAEGKDYEPLMSEVPVRIDAGIRHFANQGMKKVVIVAHSMGARMASYYLSNKKVYQEAQTQTPVVAFISIGMGADDKNYLDKLKLPVFDVFGENDLPDVLAAAPMRLKNSASNKDFKQIKVAKANHFFDDQNDALLKVVTESLTGL